MLNKTGIAPLCALFLLRLRLFLHSLFLRFGHFYHIAVRLKQVKGLDRADLHAGRDFLAFLAAPFAAHVAAHGDFAAMGRVKRRSGIFGFFLLQIAMGRGIELNCAVGAGLDAHFAGNAKLFMEVDDAGFHLFQGASGADIAAGGVLALVAAHACLHFMRLDYLHPRNKHIPVLHGFLEGHVVMGRNAGHFAAAACDTFVGLDFDAFNHFPLSSHSTARPTIARP